MLVQLSIDGQNKEQKLATVPPKGETSVSFQTRVGQAGAHTGQVSLKKDGLAGNAMANFTLDAQDKLNVLVVDGDPQTSLVQSESFFLSRALNPAGERDSSLFLPTVIVPDGAQRRGARCAIKSSFYATSRRCRMRFVANLQNFLRQGGGLLIFGGDKIQADNYNQKLAQAGAGRAAREKDRARSERRKNRQTRCGTSGAADFCRSDSCSNRSSRAASGVTRARARAANRRRSRSPMAIRCCSNKKSATGKALFMTTTADRDWTDLPLKTAYLAADPIPHAIPGRRQARPVGRRASPSTASRKSRLPPGFVGKSLRVAKPNKQDSEVPIAGAKDRAVATIADNDRAGIYRLSLPAGAAKESDAPQMYAVEPRRFSNRAWKRSASVSCKPSSRRFAPRSFPSMP